MNIIINIVMNIINSSFRQALGPVSHTYLTSPERAKAAIWSLSTFRPSGTALVLTSRVQSTEVHDAVIRPRHEQQIYHVIQNISKLSYAYIQYIQVRYANIHCPVHFNPDPSFKAGTMAQ